MRIGETVGHLCYHLAPFGLWLGSSWRSTGYFETN
jgi:hypothetical protein